MQTSNKITLWTIQHIDFYKKLVKEKTIYASLRPEIDPEFELGYSWLIAQMESKISKKPFESSYPLWAWYQWNGVKQAKPHLRYSSHLYRGTHGVRLTIQKNIKDILLSDFELWHSPYCYHDFLARNELQEKQFIQELKKLDLMNARFEDLPLHLRKQIEESWQLIFDINCIIPGYTQPKHSKSIQATFWSLELKEVIKVEEFIAK